MTEPHLLKYLSHVLLQVGGGPTNRSSSYQSLRLRAKPNSYQLRVSASIPALTRELPPLYINVTVRNCSVGEVSQDDGRLCTW